MIFVLIGDSFGWACSDLATVPWEKGWSECEENEKDKSSTKLLVRNVAFEATEKDLRQLFSPFGQVNILLAR
jgi:hypothetical protein